MKIIILLFIVNIFLYSKTTVLTIGTISSSTLKKTARFQKFAKYVVEQLKDEDIKIKVVIPKDTATAIELIKNDKLNILFDSVYPTLFIKKHTNITMDAIRWKKGKKGYRSLIFVKKDSKINLIEDLNGKTISFEDEFSTSSYFIPKKEIEAKNLNISKYLSGENLVKYEFSQSEENTMLRVFYGRTDAGAIDDISFKFFDTKKFKIIYISELIPRQLVSFTANVDKKLKEKILNVFYKMHENKVGKKILRKISKTKKFTPIKKQERITIKRYRL